jgi:hypothetical protein
MEAHVHIGMPGRALGHRDALAATAEEDGQLGLAAAWRIGRTVGAARGDLQCAEALTIVVPAAGEPDTP